MAILSVQQAVLKGFKTIDYNSGMTLKGKVLRLDFRTSGRGDWIDCYFSCAKGGDEKFKLAAFNRKDGFYAPLDCKINFGAPSINGTIFIITAKIVENRLAWSKAIKII